jgi:N-methylhydantoinase A/oxoprolinase/acetone carboxylase beta subunit
MTRFRVAVDVGGTFTDLVVQDTHTGNLVSSKVLSTPGDQAVGNICFAAPIHAATGELRRVRAT